MSGGSSHRKRSHRRVDAFGSFASRELKSTPLLVRVTDICFWSTFAATTVCFGGRAAIGQAILVCGAAITTLCWLLHQWTSPEPKYTWTGSEWLWCGGLLVGFGQLVPLPQDWLLTLSPRIREILPLWFGSEAALVSGGWRQLSLATWETASGIATFLAYAMLFLVITQRARTISDVEQLMRGAGVSVLAMAVFAIVQYFASNGKFFWTFQHPFMTTEDTPHGSFTNHNHLSQFLAMGTGPIIWWILRPRSGNESSFEKSSSPLKYIGTFVLVLGLAVADLTVLLTASRGGLLALGLATFIALTLLCRIGLVSGKFVLGLCAAGAVTAVIFLFTGYESLAQRVDRTSDEGAKASGRLEIWQANLHVTSEFPFIGTGIGTHEDAHQLRLDFANYDGLVFTHAESGYLQVASESGLAGSVVMLLMIVTSAWWCIIALKNSETRVRSLTAAIVASFVANASHATFDFFWYTPSCMLLLAIQLACACRLAAITREGSGRSAWTWTLPRPITLAAGCGTVAIMAWMVQQKLPAALAEPDYVHFLALTFQEQPTEEEDRLKLDDERRQFIIRAARRNPHDSRFQESAAIAYREMFDARQQEQSESPLSHAQIRDVVKASKFESQEALRDWLQRAVGRNIKLLHLSRKYSLRALQASPLRANAYINLAELGFLELTDPAIEALYLEQALTLRPNDPQTLFAMGKNVLLTGDLPGAIRYWRAAFHRSPRIREQLTQLLVQHVTPEFFLENFEPAWQALPSLAQAYGQVGRADEARLVWQKCIDGGTALLATRLPATDLESVSLAVRDAYFAMEDPETAIRVLLNAEKHLPYSLPIRTRLGWDLYAAGRRVEAAAHLEWCAARRPDDEALQKAASIAIKERLKTAASGSKSNPS